MSNLGGGRRGLADGPGCRSKDAWRCGYLKESESTLVVLVGCA